MAENSKMVFDSWRIGQSIGVGTDGRVSYIHKTDEDGVEHTSVLKTIFFHVDRNEDQGFNRVGDLSPKSDTSIQQIITQVIANIDELMRFDNGKRIINYEEYIVKRSKNGYNLYLRLEEARSLDSILSQYSMTQEEVMRLGISICRCLVRCRKFNYVYPYLKPKNILFDKNNVCKLGDFGSFSFLQPERASMAYNESVNYMAPDFYRSGRLNSTTDTYSLGMILYMLTNRGRLPFLPEYPKPVTAADYQNALDLRLQGTPFPKPALASDELFEVIKKACAYEYSARYFSPTQMLNDLKSVASGKPIAKKPAFEDIYSSSTNSAQTQNQRVDINDIMNMLNNPPRESEAFANLNSYQPAKPSYAPKQNTPAQQSQRSRTNQQNYSADKPRTLSNNGATQRPVSKTESGTRQNQNQKQSFIPKQEAPTDEPQKSENGKMKEGAAKKLKSLKDQIRIPFVKPSDYNNSKDKKAQNKRKDTNFHPGDLPQNDDATKYQSNIKKLSIILAAILIVLALLITSCSIKSHNNYTSEQLSQAAQAEAQASQQSSEAAVSDESQSESQLSSQESGEESSGDEQNVEESDSQVSNE